VTNEPYENEQAWRQSVEGRLNQIEHELRENTRITQELHGILTTLRGGWRVLGVFGALVKWGLAIGAAGASLWYAIHPNGGKP
jgi:hypothetical protein